MPREGQRTRDVANLVTAVERGDRRVGTVQRDVARRLGNQRERLLDSTAQHPHAPKGDEDRGDRHEGDENIDLAETPLQRSALLQRIVAQIGDQRGARRG